MCLIFRVHEIIVGIRPLAILLVTSIICQICGTIAYKSDKGGEIVFTGTPEKLVKDKKSLLTKFLKPKFSSN